VFQFLQIARKIKEIYGDSTIKPPFSFLERLFLSKFASFFRKETKYCANVYTRI